MPPSDDHVSLGYWIRRRRKALDLTQVKLAQQVGCALATIKKIETDERRPSPLMAERLADALAIPPEERAAFLRVARAELALHRLAPTPNVEEHTPPITRPPTSQPFLVNARLSSPPTNLPHRLTTFIGREQEIIDLQRLVKAHRLVTLTGVGGVGKSSLALVVAEAMVEGDVQSLQTASPTTRQMPLFPDGVWLLELAPITESGAVARLLAALFQLPDCAGHTHLEAVIAYLQHKALLLLVDNCEHLIATCAELVDRLLRAAAGLHIIATSREVLDIAGEREWAVLPLPTPPRVTSDGASYTLRQVQTFAASQLFMERAQAVKADLRFTDQDALLIAHLCYQLDGLPLALELAAARCKSFTLRELSMRLHDRFALLNTGRRTALLRHQTLRAAIDWSYDLLTPAEAMLFRRLSVFVGGWTVEAAEQVAAQEQYHLPINDLLYHLINKSLVLVDQSGDTTRYHMLETIRQYAGEKLHEHGEEETIRARHFVYYLALTEKASPAKLIGVRFARWFDAVRADLDNVRAAFAWGQTQPDAGAKSLRLAIALGPFWQLQKNVTEGSHWLDCALTHADPADLELTGWGLAWLAITLCYVSPRSFALATEAQERFIQINQANGMALANLLLGMWAVARGEAAQAITCLQQACQQFEQEDAVYFLGRAYYYLADALILVGKQNEALQYYRLALQLGAEADGAPAFKWIWVAMAEIAPDEAMTLCQQQVREQRQQKNQAKLAGLLQAQGHVMAVVGDLPGAVTILTESLALWHKLGVAWRRGGGVSRACLDLALVHYLRREHQQAMSYAQQAIHLFQAAGDLHHVAYAYVALGYPALAVNDLLLAHASFQQCLQMMAEQELNCIALALVGLAEIAHRQGQEPLAAFLLGVTERFARRPKPVEDRWKEAYCRSLQTAAYPHLTATYATACNEGQIMPFRQARQVALNFAYQADR